MRNPSKLATLCAAALTACILDSSIYTPEGCGNNLPDPGEECDGTQNSESSACLPTCRLATCGDGHVYPKFEQCDDGNKITEECEYGLESCTVCDANCQKVSGKPAFCGDGITDELQGEICDDANLSCGTCNSTCQGDGWRRATGYIYAPEGSKLKPHLTDNFTLNDGINPPVTFQFAVETSLSCVPQPPEVSPIGQSIPIAVSASCSAEEIAEATSVIINHPSLSLLISAEADGRFVWLEHSMQNDLGYQQIEAESETSSFWAVGMSGGIGEDCKPGQRCVSFWDCAYGDCVEGVCEQVGCSKGCNVTSLAASR